MNLHPMSAHLDSLAWHIDRFGYDAITQQYLRDLRVPAEAAGVRQGLIDLLTDDQAPEPVRGRAFSRIAQFLTQHFGRDAEIAVSEPTPVAARITVAGVLADFADDRVVCAA